MLNEGISPRLFVSKRKKYNSTGGNKQVVLNQAQGVTRPFDYSYRIAVRFIDSDILIRAAPTACTYRLFICLFTSYSFRRRSFCMRPSGNIYWFDCCCIIKFESRSIGTVFSSFVQFYTICYK